MNTDADDLAAFGYRQELQRGIGGFSSFAVAFSLISVLTGVFANFDHGLRHVGGAVPWSWLIVLAGQLLVALVLADLAVRMPLSGYGYQWTSRLANPHAGFFVGWMLLVQFLSGFPGVCATLARHAAPLLGPGWTTPRGLALLTLAVIALVALVHLAGLRLVAACNDAGVWAELVGVALLVAGLLAVAALGGASPAILFDARTASGRPSGPGDWALSLLLGAWCLTGFEAAADLAEETLLPRRTVPRAILGSLLAAGLAGLLLLVGLCMAISDLAATQASPAPLSALLRATFGDSGMSMILGVVGASVFACALASMAAASRLLFSLARDGMLPGSRLLAAVDPGRGTPAAAIAFVWAISSAVVIALPVLDVVTQISAVAGYIGYAGILLAAICAGSPPPEGGFTLGGARPVVGWAALAWVVGVVLALTLPASEFPGVATRHLPAVSTAVAAAVGLALYAGFTRRRILGGAAGPPAPRPAPPGPRASAGGAPRCSPPRDLA
jgi:amino acid transporter